MFNDRSSLLAFLKTRRSGKPRELVAPGPSEAELRQIIEMASRTPDHGKLNPWRFIHVPRSRRDDFAALVQRASLIEDPDPAPGRIEANEQFAHQAPELIVVIFSPVSGTKIPLWEQELSCGAACMNLLIAAAAFGYAGGWITGWPTYSEEIRREFASGNEKLAGFFFIGTPGRPLEERPRPAFEEVASTWQPNATTA